MRIKFTYICLLLLFISIIVLGQTKYRCLNGCNKTTFLSAGATSTMVYFPDRVDEDGTYYINPNRNTITYRYTCTKCMRTFDETLLIETAKVYNDSIAVADSIIQLRIPKKCSLQIRKNSNQ